MGFSSLKTLTLTSGLVLALLLVAEAEVTIPTECPAVDPPDVVTHLAYEGDCTKFYKCSHGIKYPMSCPVFNDEGDRLYFNASLQVCDWPDNVDCQQVSVKPLVKPQPPAATPFTMAKECPKVDPINQTVFLTHEDDCTKFYTCSHGAKFIMDCPVYNEAGDRLYFNPENERCDWPSKVDCKHKVVVQSLIDVTTECPAVDNHEVPVHLAHETDCSKFYTCSNGVKWEMTCPLFGDKGDRLHFNVDKQICDWPIYANCRH